MPRITAHGATFRDWEGLIGACNNNPDLMPGIEPLKADLESTLALSRELKLQQEKAAALRRASTQRVVQEIGTGQGLASKIRNFIKSRLSPSDERLKEFGIRPSTARSRKKTEETESVSEVKPLESGKKDGSPGDH